jgi:Fe-S-cluster containining protein
MANQPKQVTAASGNSAGTRLCLSCGLCCDGTLFKDVELHEGDAAARDAMESLLAGRADTRDASEVNSRTLRSRSKWPQPCAALCRDLRCQIYPDRPSRCRDFECLLLKAVTDGSQGETEALKTIRETRKVADQVRCLLKQLGDGDSHLPLSRRFSRMRRRFESGGLKAMDEDLTEEYAELTLAVHKLQLLLQRGFYP